MNTPSEAFRNLYDTKFDRDPVSDLHPLAYYAAVEDIQAGIPMDDRIFKYIRNLLILEEGIRLATDRLRALLLGSAGPTISDEKGNILVSMDKPDDEEPMGLDEFLRRTAKRLEEGTIEYGSDALEYLCYRSLASAFPTELPFSDIDWRLFTHSMPRSDEWEAQFTLTDDEDAYNPNYRLEFISDRVNAAFINHSVPRAFQQWVMKPQ